MEEELKASGHHPADTNGDGKVSKAEEAMFIEAHRKFGNKWALLAKKLKGK